MNPLFLRLSSELDFFGSCTLGYFESFATHPDVWDFCLFFFFGVKLYHYNLQFSLAFWAFQTTAFLFLKNEQKTFKSRIPFRRKSKAKVRHSGLYHIWPFGSNRNIYYCQSYKTERPLRRNENAQGSNEQEIHPIEVQWYCSHEARFFKIEKRSPEGFWGPERNIAILSL